MNYTLTQSAPVITECKDTSERIDLYLPYGLFIKPIARLNITIALSVPKAPGQAPPYAEILDKLRKQVQPEYEFTHLRIIKATLEFIRCEAEIENKSNLKGLLTKLDGSVLKLPSYLDILKIRAAESKIAYSVRHDWETFYGNSEQTSDQWEKPDTVHLNDMPIKCFAARGGDSSKPSEAVLREVFSIFGEIKMIDIPMLSSPSFSSSSSKPETFEAFIQYKDYFSFVKAMDTFRGMKLLYADQTEAYTANIRVDFDRTRHLSDKELKKREIDKLKAIEIEKIRNAQMEKEKEKENKQKEIAKAMLEMATGDGEGKSDEKTKEQRRKEREEIRRQKLLAKKQQEEEKKLEQKIALEERKILIAQRKLESMRLLEELFNRVKVVVAQEEMEKREKELSVEREKRLIEEASLEQAKRIKIEQEEAELNEKIRRNLEKQEQEAKEAQRMAEEGEFELRKTNVEPMGSPNSQRSTTTTAAAHIPVPRQIILTQQQQSPFHQMNTTPKLYDDDHDDNSNSNAPSSVSKLVQSPSEHQHDTNSNQDAATMNTNESNSQPAQFDDSKSNDTSAVVDN